MNDAGLPAYEREPYRTTLDASILGVGDDAGRAYAVLDDTILFPEGGGQPPDHGLVNEVSVLDVQKVEGEIRHYLAAPVTPGAARVLLDWERRFDHMQQHTGQHLLSALAQDRFGWLTTAFHLGPEVSDVELDARGLSAAGLTALEDAVAAEIRAAHPVRPRRVTFEEFRALPVRTRGLPEDHAGDVRLVEIEGVDLNTCGGTHLSNTAEIEVDRSPLDGAPARRNASLLRGGPARAQEARAPRRAKRRAEGAARRPGRGPRGRCEGEARPARGGAACAPARRRGPGRRCRGSCAGVG